MEDSSEQLKDEMAVLGLHIQQFFIEDRRPWAEFFGPLSAPKWTEMEIKKRITTNCSFFATNYIIICVLCCAFFILRSPGLLVILLVSLCMFLYVFMSRKKPVVVMDYTLGTREKAIAAAIGTTLLLSLTGQIFALQWSGAFGFGLCLLHAIFRPPVARALRGTNRLVSGDPELQMGDGDLEGGSTAVRGRAGPVNANIRLRTRPAAFGGLGSEMLNPPRGPGGANGTFREGYVPMMDPADTTSSKRGHSHGS